MRRFPDIRCLRGATRRNAIALDDSGTIGFAGNSGFQALNMAIAFGARRIVLVGYDLRGEYGTHWHGRHGKWVDERGKAHQLNNPSRAAFGRWRRALDSEAIRLEQAGIEVINASPISALTAFQVMTLPEAMRHFGIQE